MQSAKFSEIRRQLGIKDDDVYFFAVDDNGTIVLRRKTDDIGPAEQPPQAPGGSWAERLDL
ncbi:hypothetical protein CHL67_01070 [Prosthecochloris sp. GSB1]|uniref:AbrB/MazE/SpoVT family DNA-binding domain-containing protein n=1 Tax=Prosthecochloris sp. GSB1 TaxID=281093 RepID=UPI000B8D16F0|nr:AbrB/MazE/SpoVT family DNA-binding domain-containing protein [Prosthecochloris sp. GSB1]ASQ89698.1 hypothetical protein CHL67_01070 [Prosthecochloris sp. GSB1]